MDARGVAAAPPPPECKAFTSRSNSAEVAIVSTSALRQLHTQSVSDTSAAGNVGVRRLRHSAAFRFRTHVWQALTRVHPTTSGGG